MSSTLRQWIARHYKTRQAAYYGYEDACRASLLVIVEGEFDAASVRLALAESPEIAVCAFGKHVHAPLIPLTVLQVVLALDVDQAGQEHIEQQQAELEARGITVTIARPPVGKDWNDCHVLAGLAAIRAAIMQACAPVPAIAPVPLDPVLASPAGKLRPIEPPDYENGDVCLACGKQVPATEGAFVVCEDKASRFFGDLFCPPCWERQTTSIHANLHQCGHRVCARDARPDGARKSRAGKSCCPCPSEA